MDGRCFFAGNNDLVGMSSFLEAKSWRGIWPSRKYMESVFLAIVTIWLSDGNLFAASVSLFVTYLDHLAPMIVVSIKCMTRGKYHNYLSCQRHH